MLRIIARQVEAPDDFLSRIESIYDSFSPESFNVLRLADGRVYERMSRAQVDDGQSVGRVWVSATSPSACACRSRSASMRTFWRH